MTKAEQADDSAPSSEKIRRGLEVAYEPHPVSLGRKTFLRSKGYRIVDARFAPAGYVQPADIRQSKADAKAEAKARAEEAETAAEAQSKPVAKAAKPKKGKGR